MKSIRPINTYGNDHDFHYSFMYLIAHSHSLDILYERLLLVEDIKEYLLLLQHTTTDSLDMFTENKQQAVFDII
jgi:endoglucanase Acf2